MNMFGTSICVTGAGGSIGSEICRRLLNKHISRLVLVSLTEAGLYNIERELRPIANAQDCELVPVLGSVTDGALLREALEGVDIVLHAAAHKHVPICERNPLAAIENNVGGTYTLMMEAGLAGVHQFVLISSDKAVRPASVMGATKRVAELVLRDGIPRGSKMICSTVRFGNVLDSAGSVFPLWREQIQRGGPITITDSRCTRYFMSIPDAVDLVLGVVELESNGLFVLDMGEPRNILMMARELMKEEGHIVEVKEIGLRPGEKLVEELDYGGKLWPTKVDRVRRVAEPRTHLMTWNDMQELLNAAAVRKPDLALKHLWRIVG
jgi:FlaA1/EpsC-like NDP-sugar epimerase